MSHGELLVPADASSPASPIDLVYSWVDGADSELQRDMARHARGPDDLNPERTRDLHGLLRYSLRSAARYAPWIRNIHVITRRPQVPAWLDRSHPRVSVVHHDELAGFEPYLPTFNSTVIESFVHEIPGLSEHFLYLNDDFLFGAQITPGDFVTADGKHRIYGTYFGIWLPFRVYRKRFKFFNTTHLEHAPRFIYRPFWEEMLEAHGPKIQRTRRSRFRDPRDVRMDRLYRMWMLGPRRGHALAVPARELLRIHRFHRVDNDRERQAGELDALRRMRPKFYCLNDDQGERPDPWVCDRVHDFLEAYYPEPSAFELDAAVRPPSAGDP